MELTRLLDRLQRVRVAGSFGLPTWAHEITVTGRTATLAHVVCVGTSGHDQCYATARRAAPTEFSVAELDARGHGGSHAVCSGRLRPLGVHVELTAEQLRQLEVMEACSTATVLSRSAHTAERDADADRGTDEIAELHRYATEKLNEAAALAAGNTQLEAFIAHVAATWKITR